MPTEQLREMTEHQMIEYATRMRSERDRLREGMLMAVAWIYGSSDPPNAHAASSFAAYLYPNDPWPIKTFAEEHGERFPNLKKVLK